MTPVDWTPALVVLAIGLAGGALLLLRARGRSAPDRKPSHANDLAARRDALIRQLQELEDTGSKRTAEQLARERGALEVEAAQVLLALDAAGPPVGPAPGRESRPSSSAPLTTSRASLRGFFWGISSATALLALAFFVWQSAKPRETGASVTGNTPMAGAGSEPGSGSGEEAEIAAALERNPSDVAAHLAFADLKYARRDLMGVWNEASRVLQLSPGNPKALTYQAVVRLAMGQPQLAADLLRKAMAADPELIDAHAYLALAYARMGRKHDAETTVAAAARRFPDRADEFRKLLSEMDGEPAEQARSGEPNPHDAVASTSATAPSKPRGRHVAGTIDLDPALAGAIPPRAVLFVFVREAGAAAGPPVAVKRLPPVFPAAFDLSDQDAMMGQPFPDPLLVEARLDEDGDPTTRPPTDPKARLDGIRAGRTDLRLLLKRQ